MGEIKVGPEFLGDALMLGEFLAIVGGQRVNAGIVSLNCCKLGGR